MLDVERLERTPLFAGLADDTRRRLRSLRGRGAAVARRFRAGDLAVRQGDPGWTAFYILRDVDVQRVGLDPVRDLAASASSMAGEDLEVSTDMVSLLDGLTTDLPVLAEVLVDGTPAQPSFDGPRARGGLLDLLYRRQRPRPKMVPPPAALESSESVAELRAGDLFGEQSCFTHQPRAATVRVVDDCWMLEVMGNLLELALENQPFRDALETEHRARVLRTRLASLGPFTGLDAATLERLRSGAEIVTFAPGDTVYAEGDRPDAVYFVLRGHVRLERGGRVLRYRGRNDGVGVGAVLDDGGRSHACVVHDPNPTPRRGQPGARCELLRIPLTHLQQVAERAPDLKGSLRLAAQDDLLATVDLGGGAAVENVAGALGLLDAQSVLLIDLEKCTHCDDCVQACASVHDGIPQLVRSGPQLGRFQVATSCRQCDDPGCLVGCPVGAIHRGPIGEIVIESWCIGCGLCGEQCPYDAIDLVQLAGRRRASTCDQCATVGDATPLCVHACGAGAAQRVTGRDVVAGLEQS